MFAHDYHLNPRVQEYFSLLHSTESSHPSWNDQKKVIAFLVVTDYQGSKSSYRYSQPQHRQRTSFSLMWCSPLSCQNLSRTSTDKPKAQSENKDQEVKDITAEIATLKERLEQKKPTLLKEDFFFAIRSSSRQLQGVQISWSRGSRAHLIQIQGQSLD